MTSPGPAVDRQVLAGAHAVYQGRCAAGCGANQRGGLDVVQGRQGGGPQGARQGEAGTVGRYLISKLILCCCLQYCGLGSGLI